MRIAVLIATSVLVAGCSQGTGGHGDDSSVTAPTGTGTTRSIPTTTSMATTSRPAEAPAAGAPVGAVIAWIEAGPPADAAGFHTAGRDGTTVQLGEETAFTTPAGRTNCMTDKYHDGILACLVQLENPAPPPADAYGVWKGGWVDFSGPSLEVGSVHGDPGPFADGFGPELPYGRTLSFGDYRCRTDPAGLFCVNYAHQSAVRYSDTGIEPFGCLTRVDPPADIGEKFSC